MRRNSLTIPRHSPIQVTLVYRRDRMRRISDSLGRIRVLGSHISGSRRGAMTLGSTRYNRRRCYKHLISFRNSSNISLSLVIRPGTGCRRPRTAMNCMARSLLLSLDIASSTCSEWCTAPSSSATSPIDLNGDVAMGEALSLPESAVSQPRKGRRKPATPRGVTAGNKVKQSPIQKPQKRKSGRLSQVMTSSDESQAETKEGAQPASKSASQRAAQIAAAAGSEEGSTSPEPASGGEVAKLTLQAQLRLLSPYSLLQAPSSRPADAPPKPCTTQIDTSLHSASVSGQSTPRMSARKTPKLGPSSTPSSTRNTSAVDSPAAGSPMNGSAPGHLLKETRSDSRSEHKATLTRRNTSALTAARSTPRIKVAEQGRRNRINDALKEMQSLLPQGSNGKPSKDKSNSNDDSPEAAAAAEADLEKSKEAAVKSNSSKAATVESANVYIRAMQEQMAAVMAENAALKQQLGGESQESPPLAEQDGQKAADSASPTECIRQHVEGASWSMYGM
ncbi:hypothetical protein KC363_g98 [Hortaea werneckii]|nr:hypothetical protein KC363_g98 [Hortaea werneckii]